MKLARLTEPVQAHAAITAMFRDEIKPGLMAGHRYMLALKLETRTAGQNRFFHKLCGVVAKSGMEWAGKKRSAQQWKVLFVSGHAMATKEETEIVPGLEHEFVSIRESTAMMSVRRGSSLIEYTLAWCAQHDIAVPPPPNDWGPDDATTE